MNIEVRRYHGETSTECTQRILDSFYMQHGLCCAGCDWWHSLNSAAGECRKAAPVTGAERSEMLGISYSSLPLGAGHIFTLREHHCGGFKDEFDWDGLPAAYLKQIGHVAGEAA